MEAAAICGTLDGAPVQHGVDQQVGVVLERGGGGEVEIANHRGGRRISLQHARSGGHRQVCRDHDIGSAEGDAHDVECCLAFGDLHMGDHRAVLLRQPGEVERADRAAFEMRGHREDRTRCDDTAAADAGEQRAPWLARRGQIRLPQRCRKLVLSRLPPRIGVGCARRAGDSDEARAEAFEARQIDVAGSSD